MELTSQFYAIMRACVRRAETTVKRNRRAEIMRAAEELFTSRRFHEVTLDDVVRAAGVGKGTIYRYFRDKDDLFHQTAMDGFDELCEMLEGAPPGNAPFAEQLLNACEQISAFFAERRQLFRMMQSEEARMHWCRGEIRRRCAAKRKKLLSAVAEIIRKGVRQRRIRDDIPAEIIAGFLLGMLRARARDLADVPESSRPVGLVVSLFSEGARARPAGKCRGRQSARRRL